MNSLATFEEWATQLGEKWPKVLQAAEVSPPNRTTKKRLAEGTAPRVHAALLSALTDIERKRKTPTKIGRIMVGLQDWNELGRMLLERDPDGFARALDTLRGWVFKSDDDKSAEDAFMTATTAK